MGNYNIILIEYTFYCKNKPHIMYKDTILHQYRYKYVFPIPHSNICVRILDLQHYSITKDIPDFINK